MQVTAHLLKRAEVHRPHAVVSIFALNMPVINEFMAALDVLSRLWLCRRLCVRGPAKTKGKESRLFARCPSPVFICHRAARPPLA